MVNIVQFGRNSKIWVKFLKCGQFLIIWLTLLTLMTLLTLLTLLILLTLLTLLKLLTLYTVHCAFEAMISNLKQFQALIEAISKTSMNVHNGSKRC